MSNHIEREFPQLKSTGYSIENPKSKEYNCIAWAAGENNRWWWPDQFNIGFWPTGIPREESLKVFIMAFEQLGYSVCKSANFEEGYEKIAIYIDLRGKPVHAARQLSTSHWTSKLGKAEDVNHSIAGFDNSCYGSVAVIMKQLKN